MDSTDPDIVFDSDGVCNHCTNAIKLLKQPPYGLPPYEKELALNQLIENIKKTGKNKEYDCIIGLSGGVDSSYVAYLVKKWGLRPLAIHLDNGWNLELAVKNIENVCKKLDIDLYTDILDWEEFKDLQLAFLKASTPDSEIPTDNLIFSSLFKAAGKYGIKYILTGYNAASESILARAWSQGYYDKTYINAVYKQYGTIKRNFSFHILSTWEILLKRLCGTKLIATLDYISYNKEEAKIFMNEQFGWKDYGRKHGESNYTRIFQEYILPVKFGFDKRKAHFSSLIAAGLMTREEALKKLSEPLYADEHSIKQDIDTLCRKFEITNSDFERIIDLPVKSIYDYPNNGKTFRYKLFNLLLSLRRKFLRRKFLKRK
jgi:N-acetyl sugar amidotransferase